MRSPSMARRCPVENGFVRAERVAGYFSASTASLSASSGMVRKSAGGMWRRFEAGSFRKAQRADCKIQATASEHDSRVLQRGAVTLEPANSDARSDQAITLLELKQYNTAIPAYDAAIKLTPKVASLYGGLGDAWLGAGDQEKARAAYDAALQQDPGYWRANRARATRFSKHRGRAIRGSISKTTKAKQKRTKCDKCC